MLAVRLLDVTGVVAQDLNGASGFANAFLEGFAFLARQLPADIVLAGSQNLGCLVQDGCPGDGGGVAPRGRGIGGGLNSGIDIGPGRCGKFADQLIGVGRVAAFECSTRFGWNPCSTDVISPGFFLRGDCHVRMLLPA